MVLRIETERLVLTPEEPADAGWFTELLNARGTGVFTRSDAVERIAAMTETIATSGIGVLAVRRRSDDAALGYCGLVVGRGSLAEPELAYELLRSAHGRGYATEAAHAVLTAAFATGRTRIWATVRSWNEPSFRVLAKLGFARDHTTADDAGELVWLVHDG
ncbi:GNAT family N-acetyltransferase [Modestobacter sp. VKM Ac-2979]|uniref:GNAT family N-acetyltransferase n=1 Tax=unclassified Modestobacter TaxID=2643866 RepID=UPI0022AB8800|nr:MULTISPECIES: GNAT family N-acetyltransferase [unclassified Modestobacter]MCZ2813774.1 GNAT family N-acetyltransferase [Modestobacter sp. VKM Ac-2979]MCZ2844251.1 GNAT family N-acetyltransferase [Modestobacter sp. VKM Ac-2980]